MSLSQGRPYLAIPGPSVMPDAVLRAMHRAAPNIYEGELVETTASLVPDLKRVARTDGHVAMYIANGHGAWEAALANTLNSGDRVLVPATGRFGHGWAEMAQAMGIEVELIDFGRSSPVDPQRIEDALRADTEGKIRAVLVTHVDTSSSILNDVPLIRAAIDSAGHDALLFSDNIASLGCDRFEMDLWGVDVMVAGSQKGLMTPPGMAFVFFSDKAAAAQGRVEHVSPYWNWAKRANPEMYYQYFGGTAATHHIYGLRVALDMIHEEGLENVWTRHDVLARALWAACDVWSEGGVFTLNVTDPVNRSRAVTAARLGAPHGTKLREWTATQAGVTLGIGLGMSDEDDPKGDGYFRFGHMGHLNAHMMLGLIGVIETGLDALGLPHGTGGTVAASRVIAGALL